MDEGVGCGAGGCGVLASDEKAVADDVRLPVVGLGVDAAEAVEFVFDEEGDDARESDRVFFGVGEAGDLLAVDEGRAVPPG
ncbi:predicted protein [Streptomyces iranensis]|uniref:Uncharacterized protein n=1 Tax=Streptomyces iranensis TaxID=576784 RepID=A0A060ZBQ2_9ACTN|nr:hypothetical protein [Streptomyces iranensis]MBP2063385.1 hypothetical protein [Streptomyces iranensis]CDR01620.1 predicted protein [Streptomyces iranensis]